MRIGHCQVQPVFGDFDGCLAKLVGGLEKAEIERVEIVSFPECFFCGYYDREEPAREHAFPVESPQVRAILQETRHFSATFIVGFNEVRGPDLYNTAMIVKQGELLGTYSKSCAYMPFHKQGRSFPVFERSGVKFGVIICADGGYIEPARILALKGARIIFAPHANYIGAHHLIGHFMRVRRDHAARATENDVWFVRGCDVILETPNPAASHEGVGYGDSYIMDPSGEIVVRSRRHHEDFIVAEIDPEATDIAWGVGRSRFSLREFGQLLLEAADVPDRPV